ncbi:hypothetical protein DITRI_Ditri02bG0165300 [Diplodiscus trichospermus]
MALLLREKPGLIEGSIITEAIVETPDIDASLLMSLLEESHFEENCNEEQLNSLMESLEAEIRMQANHGFSGDIESNDGADCFELNEHLEMVPSSPSDDMNWNVENHVEEILMDDLVEIGNHFPRNYHQGRMVIGVRGGPKIFKNFFLCISIYIYFIFNILKLVPPK